MQVTASNIQTRESGAFSVMTLTIYFVYVFLAAGVSYGAHVPCGLFTPNLLIGSSLGCAPPSSCEPSDIKHVAAAVRQNSS